MVNSMIFRTSLVLIMLFSIYGCGNKTASTTESETETDTAVDQRTGTFMFDDFNYDSYAESYAAFTANGWKARTATGHPGVEGAAWSAQGVSFHPAGDKADNGILRMTSYTDGTAANTQHTQICHARKYYRGTYAARVFFRDMPTKGPDGDVVIQTFYAISPLKAPMNLDYSEMDFEYLPNGGWGESRNALWSTTWETFQLEPWTKVNEFSTLVGSYDGWHTLVMHADADQVRYFVDGVQFAEHSAKVAPEKPMSINFNLWFTAEGPIDSDELRQYDEDIDWVYHEAGSMLSTEEVEQKVAALRAKDVDFKDTVPAWSPKLPSPCGL